MSDMTLSSRHRIRNSNPGGLRLSTLPLGHGGSPQVRSLKFQFKMTAKKLIKPSPNIIVNEKSQFISSWYLYLYITCQYALLCYRATKFKSICHNKNNPTKFKMAATKTHKTQPKYYCYLKNHSSCLVDICICILRGSTHYCAIEPWEKLSKACYHAWYHP